MTGRKVLGLCAMLALAGGLTLAPGLADAKKCAGCAPKVKLCKNTLKSSPQYSCTGKKGKEKRQCVHTLNQAIKAKCVLKACKNAAPCSPSGAFVD